MVSKSGSSSFGRAVAFQASGGRFEPGLPLFFKFAVEQLYAMEAANWATSRCSSVVEHPDGNREGHKGSLPFNGSISRCSSVVEHFLGKEEVKGSIPFNGSIIFEGVDKGRRIEFRIIGAMAMESIRFQCR